MDEDTKAKGLRVGEIYNNIALMLNALGVTVMEATAVTSMLFVNAWTNGEFDLHEEGAADFEEIQEYLAVVSELMARIETEQHSDLDIAVTGGLFGGDTGGEA